MGYVVLTDKFKVGDTVYIMDLDKIAIVDEIMHLDEGITYVALETDTCVVLTPIYDTYLINIDRLS